MVILNREGRKKFGQYKGQVFLSKWYINALKTRKLDIFVQLHGCRVAWLQSCLVTEFHVAKLHGYISALLYRCMVPWLHSCMVAQLYGCMVAELLGYRVSWLQNCKVTYMHCCIVAWFQSCMVPELYGCKVAWLLAFCKLQYW